MSLGRSVVGYWESWSWSYGCFTVFVLASSRDVDNGIFPLQTRSCVEPGYAAIVVTVNVGKANKHNQLADTK
jgi:hypothetical protein